MTFDNSRRHSHNKYREKQIGEINNSINVYVIVWSLLSASIFIFIKKIFLFRCKLVDNAREF